MIENRFMFRGKRKDNGEWAPLQISIFNWPQSSIEIIGNKHDDKELYNKLRKI